ncbi:MAG: Glutaredoxin arsenate reductase [candidate division WS2 bacterium]|nr:Glutaredoxin arsenate reductase [Candidatus Lithacetigena glycinireducens]MBT9175594.1 Glutaredoxin arsenate reductase [Candidatus Lithacetigena glycinireducens]
MKKRILFLCTHNSSRSQMAEGIVNSLYGDKYQAYSAGTHPSGINPFTIKVMSEIGIDISSHRSKNVKEFKGWTFDFIVTVCDQAQESCPFFPGAVRYIHQGFTDPSAVKGSFDDKMRIFRRVRDEIKNWIEETFNEKGEQEL